MARKTIKYKVNLRSTLIERNNPVPKVFTNDKHSVAIEFEITDLQPMELVGAEASVLLFMKDGSFFQNGNEDVTLSGNTLTYILKENEGQHAGLAEVQLVVTLEGKEYATQLYKFEIMPGLGNKAVTEVMVNDWNKLTKEARTYLDALELSTEQVRKLTAEGFIELKMDEKLQELESTYANRLLSTEQQLAQKADKSQIGAPTQEQVNAWLAANPQATTTVQDGSVEGIKLKNNFSFKKNLTTEDLNAVLDSGIYSTSAELLNKPSNTGNTAIISVSRIGGTGTYVIQEYTDVLNPANLYRRICRIGYSFGPWYKVQVGDIPTNSLDAKVLKDATVSTTKLTSNYTYKGSKGATDDLNTINTAGLYLYTEQAPNMPTGFSSGMLSVETTGSFAIQEFQSISGDYNEVYRRVILPNSAIYKPWYKLVNQDMIADNKATKPLEGKTIVQFGDSIYGNNRPPNDISTALANKTGATVLNLGMGGSKMSAHAQYWDATSMYRLADSIATGDYTLQDELIAEYDAGRLNGLPYYVKSVIQLMKTIDWNDVDIITIAHGTNDYTSTDAVLDNESNRYDTTTYGGALRHSLKTILEAYPHIKVVVISPMYRFWTESEAPYNFIIDSDEEVLSGNKLTEYVAKAKEISGEEKTVYIDAYTHFGIGKSNRHYHFDDLTGKGGTHHNNNGAKYIGEKLGSEIVAKF